MQNKYTNKAIEVLELAAKIAKKYDHEFIGTEHILVGLLTTRDNVAASVLKEFGAEYDKLCEIVEELIGNGSRIKTIGPLEYTPRSQNVLNTAASEAARFGAELIGAEHILIGIIKESDCVAARLLEGSGINIQRLYIELLIAMGQNENIYKEDFQNGKLKPTKGVSSMPTVMQYGTDLTKEASEGKLDPLIGREDEVKRVIQILSRRTKNNPCLIGEPGVGKTAVAEGLARKIVDGEVPENLANKKVITLDLSGMVAGTKYRGEFEERIKRVIAEVRNNGNIILFLDEIHTLIGAGNAEGAMDAANIIKPALSRSEIQIIGATTTEEYRKHIEKDAALERRFQSVKIEEPSKDDSIKILEGLRAKYEEHHNVTISDEAIDAAVSMSIRYVNDRFLPDKAIDLIDEAASMAKIRSGYEKSDDIKKLEKEIDKLDLQIEEALLDEAFELARKTSVKQKRRKDKLNKLLEESRKKDDITVTEDDVAEVVSLWTKIPVKKLAIEESERLSKLESVLHERVVGQDEAVSSVAKAIRRGRVGLKDPKRPTGSFLFLGPTGVGKTELSKALAEAMFGNENSLIRVDMSEYMEKQSVSKIIGSPPGYVGFDEGGQLSEKVRRNPYAVILFDEIEKAHPDVFNILLQVLDDGRITDSTGRVVDFKNTIIIMTSNAGAMSIVEPKSLGFASSVDEKKDHDAMKNKVMEEVKRIFRPEFINRIDEIIVFHMLNKEHMGTVVDIMIEGINRNLKGSVGISINLDDEAKKFIIDKGYDSKYGARPLRRVIQTKIEDGLAEKILDGTLKVDKNKQKIVNVTLVDGKIEFFAKNSKSTRKKS